MHNWHLLLFAFLAFLHSIVCFPEHSLVDGREQCCDRNNLLRDTRISRTFLVQKPTEDRRLISRVELRKDRRYEVIKDVSELTRLTANRRLVDFRSQREASPNSHEIAHRLTLTKNQRVRLTNDRRERTLPALETRVRRFADFRRTASNDISRDERIKDIARQRFSRDFDTRLHERDNREFKRLSHVNGNRMVQDSSDEARRTASYDSRRDSQRIRNREVANEFRRLHSREMRDLLQRTRTDTPRSEISKDGREVRERMDERRVFRLRSNSQLQSDTNREHRSLEREVSDSRDTRRWTLASRSADRIRSVRHETISRLREDVRDQKQRVDSRRVLTERLSDNRQSRDESREYEAKSQRERRERIVTIHRVSKERTSAERRSSRNSVDRVRNIDNRDMRLERVTNRRDSRADERVPNRKNRPASEYRRLESRRTMRQEIRQYENILNRKDRGSSDRMEIRDMKREVRSRFAEARERGIITIEQRTLKNNMEREDVDPSYRTNEFRRKRESFGSSTREKVRPLEEATVLNWQYLFYILQGIYVCSLLIQIMSENESKKKSR